MKLIKDKAAFKRFYPYKCPPNKEPCPRPSEYPKRYPCFCAVVHHDGGLGGDYMTVNTVYPPRGADLRSFMAGLRAAGR